MLHLSEFSHSAQMSDQIPGNIIVGWTQNLGFSGSNFMVTFTAWVTKSQGTPWCKSNETDGHLSGYKMGGDFFKTLQSGVKLVLSVSVDSCNSLIIWLKTWNWIFKDLLQPVCASKPHYSKFSSVFDSLQGIGNGTPKSWVIVKMELVISSVFFFSKIRL